MSRDCFKIIIVHIFTDLWLFGLVLCREADASKEQLESMLANHETGNDNVD